MRWRNVLQQHDVKKKKTKYGHGEAWGALNNLNWRSTDLNPAHIHGFDQNDVVLRPCFQCARLCPWDAKLGEGKFKGTVVHFNAGGEWLDTFFNLGIKGNAVLYLAEKINNLGIECSHFSCGAGVAFEAWEKGVLGPDRTDGLRLEWGNVEAVDKLLDMAARREGWLGNLLADGPKQLAEALGGDAPKWAVHTKGGTPAMHEWRPLLGQMLRELVASGGMKPQGGGSKNPPPDLRDKEKWGPLDMDNPEGWVWSHVLSEQNRQFTGHLNRYYGEVVECLRDAESIFIFGPGEAKGELEKRLASKGLGGRVVGIETVDKMTERQIAAKVRQYFFRSRVCQ